MAHQQREMNAVRVATTNAEGRGDGMPCPVCKVDLVMSERQGIEIDYCPKCRGVWLDRGELDKIIERSAGEQVWGSRAQPPAQPQASQVQSYPAEGFYQSGHGSTHGGHDGGHGSGSGRRRSFLGNLFD